MNFVALKNFMDHLTGWRIPGNSVSVCIEGKEVFSYASGYADVERKIPMTKAHLVNLYSCSKVATVTAALQLYEQGKFLLDDPLYEYIPEFRDMYISDDQGVRKAQNPITLRHLFTMTSGLSYDSKTEGFAAARKLTDGKMDTLTVIRCLAKDPISFEPGTTFQYGLSLDVLAGVVEVISGKRFRDYMREHIFDPLGMECAVYHNQGIRDKMAMQYEFIDGSDGDLVARQSGAIAASNGFYKPVGYAVDTLEYGPEYDSGGAGITTSVADYSKFCAALANGGISQTGEKILGAGTIDLLRINQLTEVQRKTFDWPQLKGYGYGLGVRTLIDKAAGSTGNLGEFGWGGAAGASVWIDPDLKLSVCYAHHMLNPQEEYYQPRVRNVVYGCVL